MTHAVGHFNHWTASEGPAKPFEKEDEERVWLVFANFLVWNALFLQLSMLIRSQSGHDVPPNLKQN